MGKPLLLVTTKFWFASCQTMVTHSPALGKSSVSHFPSTSRKNCCSAPSPTVVTRSNGCARPAVLRTVSCGTGRQDLSVLPERPPKMHAARGVHEEEPPAGDGHRQVIHVGGRTERPGRHCGGSSTGGPLARKGHLGGGRLGVSCSGPDNGQPSSGLLHPNRWAISAYVSRKGRITSRPSVGMRTAVLTAPISR